MLCGVSRDEWRLYSDTVHILRMQSSPICLGFAVSFLFGPLHNLPLSQPPDTWRTLQCMRGISAVQSPDSERVIKREIAWWITPIWTVWVSLHITSSGLKTWIARLLVVPLVCISTQLTLRKSPSGDPETQWLCLLGYRTVQSHRIQLTFLHAWGQQKAACFGLRPEDGGTFCS
jgi:hypothetical protein